MTIINDVNVELCPHICLVKEKYLNDMWYECTKNGTLCKDNPDCYFKQFKRLEKENEELKAKLTNYMNFYGELYGKMNKIAFEHVTYKNTLEEIKEMLKNESPYYGAQEIITKIDEVLR